MQLEDVGNIALQSGLSPQGAMAAMAIAKTEGGLTGAVGDSGQSFGPFQFYSGGQLRNFAQAMHVSLAEAGQIARTEPEIAVRWALAPGGYLGDVLRKGEAQGLKGSQLATYAQRYGQVSVSPERAGQNYDAIWGNYDPGTSSPSSGAVANSSAGGTRYSPGVAMDMPRLSMGTMQPAAASSSRGGGYVFPVSGYQGQVQDHWGSVKGGSDLFAPRGTPIVAMAPGKVSLAGWNAVGGNAVEIEGDDGNEYYYAHGDAAPSVKVGQRVGAGTYLMPVGDTGDAKGKGTHLHIGIGPKIQLGSDKYGGTGGDFDAVGLLQQTLQGGGGTTMDAFQPGIADDMPRIDMSQFGQQQPKQQQRQAGIADDMPHLDLGSWSMPQSTPSSSDQGPGDGWSQLTPGLWGSGPQIQDTTNDWGMDMVPPGLLGAPTNDWGFDMTDDQLRSMQANPDLIPV